MTEDETMEGREIADLLPFYAAGTLTASERSRVADALARDPALRRELSLVEEEQQATIEVNEAIRGPSRAASQRLFEMLDAAPRPAASRFDIGGWLAAKIEALRPRTMAYAAGFACLVLVAQAGIIGTMMSSRSGGGFETASVETTGVAGTVIVVSFTPNARAADIDKLLAETKASIVAGPLPGGLYQLRIGDKLLSTAARDKIVDTLKARTAVIRFAAPASSDAE